MEAKPFASLMLENDIIQAIKTVYDPELSVDVYEMGLIYDIAISPENVVDIKMTLTSPGCPVAQDLPMEVETKVRAVSGVREVSVEIVWEPPWGLDRMSEIARMEMPWL